ALRQAVQVEFGETVLLPFDDPVFDAAYAHVPESASGPDEHAQVAVVAAPRQEVERVAGMVQAAGLRPWAADISALAIARAAGHGPWQSAGLRLFLQSADEQLSVAVFLGGTLCFLRALELSDAQVWQAGPGAVASDAAYEIERVVQFFHFHLAGQESPVEHVWVSAPAEMALPFTQALAQHLPWPVSALPVLVRQRPRGPDPHRYAAAIGLALKGRTA
ncbi:MAG: hypothetical protein K6T31_03525, partial [Alicyclobacillus sp.]|nr:hypothetical protein [Alicyclobacillus sp.]